MSVCICRIWALYLSPDSSIDSLSSSRSNSVIFGCGLFKIVGLCSSCVCIIPLSCSFVYYVFYMMTLVLMFRITAFLYKMCAMKSSRFIIVDVDEVLLICTLIGLLSEASMI